jgi:hypothetical protein
MTRSKGWKFEPARHSLASKGIETKQLVSKIKIQNPNTSSRIIAALRDDAFRHSGGSISHLKKMTPYEVDHELMRQMGVGGGSYWNLDDHIPKRDLLKAAFAAYQAGLIRRGEVDEIAGKEGSLGTWLAVKTEVYQPCDAESVKRETPGAMRTFKVILDYLLENSSKKEVLKKKVDLYKSRFVAGRPNPDDIDDAIEDAEERGREENAKVISRAEKISSPIDYIKFMKDHSADAESVELSLASIYGGMKKVPADAIVYLQRHRGEFDT